MPTYRGLKTIFVHIPKAAGSGIANRLWTTNKGTGEDSLEYEKHESILNVQAYLEPAAFNEYFKFAMVRNPYDRLVSWYHYYQDLWRSGKAEINPCNPEHIEQFLDMDFLTYAISLKSPYEWDCHTGVACPHHMIAPQYKYIIGYGDFILVDFVGRVEELDANWKIVCARTGMDYQILEVVNKTEHKPWQSYYTNGWARQNVRRLYEKDFKYFGYSHHFRTLK